MKRGNKKDQRHSRRKGLSPVIATVLLIGIVVVIALIIFTWFRGFTQEAVIKFDQNAQLVCDEIQFQASLSESILSVSNFGNVPIYGLMLKLSSASGFETRDIKELSGDWPDEGLIQGGVFSGEVASKVSDADDVTIIPILRGSSQRGGEASFVCNENRHGYKLS